MNRRSIPLAIAVAAVIITAGCGTDSSTGGPTTAKPSATATSTAASATASGATSSADAPRPTGTLPSEGKPSDDAMLTPTNVETGAHNDFDRVVIELGGTGTPGWIAEWTDNPSSPGSGDPIEVLGQSVLRIRITGAGYPGDTGAEFYSGPNPAQGIGVISEVHLTGVFEGEAEVFIGVQADKPKVRISTLSSPTRLVIDIANIAD